MSYLRYIALLILLLTVPLSAHQQKEAITRVLFNPRTGNIEIMHRFLLHDAEHAVKELVDVKADILGSASTRQAFANYVYQRFAISDQDGQALPLSPVGQEIEGRFIWVYQETPIPAALSVLHITHNALRDIWPEQINLVNVERDGNLKSATFQADSREMTIELQQQK